MITPTAFHRPALWIGVGFCLIAVTVWFSLEPHPPSWAFALGPQAVHALTYGLLTFWFGQLYGGLGRRLIIAAAFALMGAVLEGVQGEMSAGRTMSAQDLVANIAGTGVAVVLLQTPAGALLLRFDTWLGRPRD